MSVLLLKPAVNRKASWARECGLWGSFRTTVGGQSSVGIYGYFQREGQKAQRSILTLEPTYFVEVGESVSWFTFCHPRNHSKTFPQPTKQLQESSLAQWWHHRGPRWEKRKYHSSLAILQTFPKWLPSRVALADYTEYTSGEESLGQSVALCPKLCL